MGGATKFLMLLAAPFPPRSPSLLRLARRHHHHYRRHLSSLSSLSVHPHPGLTASHRRTASIAVNCSSQQLHSQTSTIREEQQYFSESNPAAPVGAPHPWPEWLNLLENLSASGYFNEGFEGAVALDSREDEFAADVHLPAEFAPAVRACLAFARDRPWLLQTLARSDIKVLVENGTPFLFKSADDSIRKMRTFLDGDGDMAVDTDRAKTIDLMRFLLSYASSPSSSGETAITNEELIISSVRNLVGQLARQGGSPAALSEPNFSDPIQNSFPGRQGPMSKPRGQNVEMKRGDWLCERCNFMNFARNMKCLECDEARPKRQLTGGEWECPQCCFFNYSRNTACLRCDCKRPGMLPHTGSRYSVRNYTQKDVESRLAANEEKAQRWFSKVSKMDSTSDTSSALADEDFPEIMPLRKGVNRFVVSTRKTPLERRLANAEHQRSLGNDANLASSDSQMGNENNNSDSMTSRKLNEILGRKSVDQMNASNISPEQGRSQGSNSSYSPFVPLPPDMFAKKPANSQIDAGGATEDGNDSLGLDSRRQISSADGSKNTEREQEEKSERWFKRISELHDSPDLTTAISDDEFPEIMPVRKGENRFVVSKKKDRSLTSPMYKRQAAMEQARSSNFVPFVPFPPDYFAKKDNQQSGADSGGEAATCFTSSKPNELLENANSSRNGQKMENHRAEPANGENSLRELGNSQTDPGVKNMNETSNQSTSTTSSSSQPLKSYSWTGKSLEGSAVKEPDPLDMSEEAKAERWFRRVAQIKDISELSQIPDEDFPSIMPMRKGVNRFVVSKRKTPLERRLTSSQYRKNLPVVSSDPLKKENDSN